MARTVSESLEARSNLYERINYDVVPAADGGAYVYFGIVPADVENAPAGHGWRCLHVTPSHLTIYPFKLTERGYEQKYPGITGIGVTGRRSGAYRIPTSESDVEEILNGLPEGLEKNPLNGLGFSTADRFIPASIAALADEVLVVIQGGDSAPDWGKGVYVLSELHLKRLSRGMRSISTRHQRQARQDRSLLAHNSLLSSVAPADFPAKRKKVSNESVFELVRIGGVKSKLPKSSQRDVIDLVADNAGDMAKTEPAKLRELAAKIESATLQEMIKEYEAMLQKSLSEPKWQTFFEANTFLLSLVFSVPTIFVQQQPYVHGKRIDGRGGRFSDFLMRGQGTGNVALVEIKAPDTLILAPYRDEQKGPSRDLAGAITQVLGQRLKLCVSWGLTKLDDAGALEEAEMHSPQAVVLIGRLPPGKADKQAFELFRQVLRDVTVVTFDELLQRLKYLHQVLGGTGSGKYDSNVSDVPF